MYLDYKHILSREWANAKDSGSLPAEDKPLEVLVDDLNVALTNMRADIEGIMSLTEKIVTSPEEEAMTLDEFKASLINRALRRVYQII